jgi:HD superfamily phosphohydrolase
MGRQNKSPAFCRAFLITAAGSIAMPSLIVGSYLGEVRRLDNQFKVVEYLFLGREKHMAKPRRIRDPVHDLIPFDTSKFEQMAWKLLELPEFQRLRRIKQLGFSELVFPGATHSRFAHSVGVFHTARQLAQCIKNQVGENYNEERAQVAMAAALVHDVGHGPFSHAFEAAAASFSQKKDHEDWTAEIVTGSTGVKRVLESFRKGFSKEVANVIVAETPGDIYASIVSS